MKLPNGFGSVYKLSGNRRKPWVAAKTFGWELDAANQKVKQKQQPIGYFATKQEALIALSKFNEDPYDLRPKEITFSEVYERWSAEHFPKLSGPSSIRTITAAYKYCAPLYSLPMHTLRVEHLERTIKEADVGSQTKARMKSLFNLMYKYAMKHEIVDKDYAQLCDSIKKERSTIERVPFSEEEIAILFKNQHFPFADMVLVALYSGWRPQEVAVLKTENVHLDTMSMGGGLKTDAGKRTIPIHPKIQHLVTNAYEYAVSQNSDTLFLDPSSQTGKSLTYDKYRKRFTKVMQHFGMKHKPHDTRHTFITKAKQAGVDEYILKLIVGHAIKDITESVYTHRTLEDLRIEIEKIE